MAAAATTATNSSSSPPQEEAGSSSSASKAVAAAAAAESWKMPSYVTDSEGVHHVTRPEREKAEIVQIFLDCLPKQSKAHKEYKVIRPIGKGTFSTVFKVF